LDTILSAAIATFAVSIIAFFKIWMVLCEVGSNDIIATAGRLAVGGAGVIIHHVAIITSLLGAFCLGVFTQPGDAIAAVGDAAVVGTVVLIVGIAVITGFKARYLGVRNIGSSFAIAATGLSAVVQAVIVF